MNTWFYFILHHCLCNIRCLLSFPFILTLLFCFYVDILVCLVTLEVESFGSEVLAQVRLIENKVPVPKAVTPKPQSNQSSTLQGTIMQSLLNI